MRFSSAIALTAAVAVHAKTIQVAVGENGLSYSPNDIQADQGDIVEFSFFPKVSSPTHLTNSTNQPQNHTVTQSSFADPCHPLSTGGFFSSFVPTAAGTAGSTFSITVNTTKPIWFYCGQGIHCQSGMVGAINAPATGNTLLAFEALAQKANSSTSPDTGVVGGILRVAEANESSTVEIKTVTATVTKVITTGSSTYSTTYSTTYPSTYTEAVTATATSSSALAISTGAANGLVVNGGMAGAVVFAALAML